MNGTVFFVICLAAQCAVVWLSYSIGHEDGWLDGWDDRRS